MRRLFTCFFILSLVSAAFGQTNQQQVDPNQQQGNQNTDQSQSNTEKIPDGYGDVTWEMYLSDARDKISGVLTYSDEKTVIVSRDKELEYHYGFFYKEPSTDTTTSNNETENTQEKDEGKLFYVSMNFPYLAKDQVYDKIQKKYGKHTQENVKDNKGAIAWNSENTIIIMWVDQYERKSFCRRIVYISKKVSSELNEYTYSIFNKTEIDLIKNMNP
jgi:hypothetical protein